MPSATERGKPSGKRQAKVEDKADEQVRISAAPSGANKTVPDAEGTRFDP